MAEVQDVLMRYLDALRLLREDAIIPTVRLKSAANVLVLLYVLLIDLADR